jgi:hypothetical protein
VPLILENVRIEPIEEIKIAAEPAITKIENSSINGNELLFIFLLFCMLYLFRIQLFYLLTLIAKVCIMALFAYSTYILFLK